MVSPGHGQGSYLYATGLAPCMRKIHTNSVPEVCYTEGIPILVIKLTRDHLENRLKLHARAEKVSFCRKTASNTKTRRKAYASPNPVSKARNQSSAGKRALVFYKQPVSTAANQPSETNLSNTANNQCTNLVDFSNDFPTNSNTMAVSQQIADILANTFLLDPTKIVDLDGLQAELDQFSQRKLNVENHSQQELGAAQAQINEAVAEKQQALLDLITAQQAAMTARDQYAKDVSALKLQMSAPTKSMGIYVDKLDSVAKQATQGNTRPMESAILSDKIKKIKITRFDGNKLKARLFLNLLTNQIVAYAAFRDEIVQLHLAPFFEGDAAEWFLRNDFQTWMEFNETFRKRFVPSDECLREEMDKVKQTGNDTPTEILERLQRLFEQMTVPIPEEEKMIYTLEAMSASAARLIKQSITLDCTWPKLCSVVSDIERMAKLEERQKQRGKAKAAVEALKATSTPTDTKLQDDKSKKLFVVSKNQGRAAAISAAAKAKISNILRDARAAPTNGGCYRCGGGHFMRDCKFKPEDMHKEAKAKSEKVFLVLTELNKQLEEFGVEDSDEDDFLSPTDLDLEDPIFNDIDTKQPNPLGVLKSEPKVDTLMVNINQKKPGALPYLTVQIGGKKAKALFDCGASRPYISGAMLKHLNMLYLKTGKGLVRFSASKYLLLGGTWMEENGIVISMPSKRWWHIDFDEDQFPFEHPPSAADMAAAILDKFEKKLNIEKEPKMNLEDLTKHLLSKCKLQGKEYEKLCKLIKKYETTFDENAGCHPDLEHTITTGDAKPFKYPEDDTPWPDVPTEYTKLKTEFTLNRDSVLFIFAPFKSDIYLEDVDNSAGLKIVVPKSLQNKCLALVHDYSSSGHGGGDVTYERLRRSFFWVNCRQDTVKYVAKCDRCQRCKPIQRKPKGLLQPISGQIGRFERIGLDLMGPKPMTTNRNKFILVIVDYATGWVEVVPLRNAKILTLVPHIMSFFQTYGVPRYIVSDNGKQFVSDIYNALCENAGIIPNCTSPYHPQTNYTERINRNIKIMLQIFTSEHKHWDRVIGNINFALRTASSATTGITDLY
uniref:RNA-directed DNA polymerase n=1 Tax=Strigamia maritima TaxID=126957 RepID=T1IH95_STRMM